jgi:hypothetical protein
VEENEAQDVIVPVGLTVGEYVGVYDGPEDGDIICSRLV